MGDAILMASASHRSDASEWSRTMANKGFNGVLSLSSKDVGQKMALATVDYFTKLAWSSLLGDKTDTVIDLIHQLSRQLDDIRNDISQLATQVADFQLDVKLTDIESHATEIESIYQKYQTRLTNYMSATEKGQADLAAAHKRELHDVGKEIEDNVFNRLRQIHRLLTATGDDNKGVLQLYRQKYKDRDLFTYFFAMQSVMTRFFSVQMQGITLLTLAGQDTTVNLASFREDAQHIDANIKAQIKQTLGYFPGEGLKLINAMIRSESRDEWMPPVAPRVPGEAPPPWVPDEPTPMIIPAGLIYFPGAEVHTVVSTSLRSVAMKAAGRAHCMHLAYSNYGNLGTFDRDESAYWFIVPVDSMAPPPAGKPYLFILEYVIRREVPLVLGLSGSQYGAVACPLPGQAEARSNRWAIYLDDSGALWFEYHGNYVGGSFNDFRLTVDLGRNQPLYYARPSSARSSNDLFVLMDEPQQIVASA